MYETKSPVLVIIFNRPGHTKAVLDAMRAVRPERIYIAADAPRKDREGETKKCMDTLNVLENIDWPCEIFRKINEVNLGSHTTIPRGIDWFFENEESGIVLEDDCLPSESFFRYCDELLERHKKDERIMWINGSNLGYPGGNSESNYCFSNYAISWGWASWRRAWALFDGKYRDNLPNGVSSDVLQPYVGHSLMLRLHWRFTFEYAYAIKNWDIRWMYVMWANGGLSCSPTANMISNIGFGPGGVHCVKRNDSRANIPAKENPGPFKTSSHMVHDMLLDTYLNKVLYKISVLSILKMYIASRFPVLRNFARRIQGKPI